MALPEEKSEKTLTSPSRRRFMQRLAAAGSLSCISETLLSGCTNASQHGLHASTVKHEDAAVLDEALALLARTGPEYFGGLANHGPMAAEALVSLGRSDAVMLWVERYKRNLQSPPESRKAITRENWREALGDISRVGDWIAFFNLQMKEAGWRAVLGEWATRLAPGLVAAAAHGLIRTGHAARSLSQKETDARRFELAQGLAYWAARYQLLPVSRERITTSRLKPSEALKQIERLPTEQRTGGLIADSLQRLDGFPPFARVAGLVDANGDASRFLSDLTEAFAGVYLANAQKFGSVIAFIHAVTGPSAIRLLLPYVKPEETGNLLRYGWQAAAGLYAAFAIAPPAADAQKFLGQSREDLIDRAVAAGDEHAIKFTEACLREYAINPKPVYLSAARHAVDYLKQK